MKFINLHRLLLEDPDSIYQNPKAKAFFYLTSVDNLSVGFNNELWEGAEPVLRREMFFPCTILKVRDGIVMVGADGRKKNLKNKYGYTKKEFASREVTMKGDTGSYHREMVDLLMFLCFDKNLHKKYSEYIEQRHMMPLMADMWRNIGYPGRLTEKYFTLWTPLSYDVIKTILGSLEKSGVQRFVDPVEVEMVINSRGEEEKFYVPKPFKVEKAEERTPIKPKAPASKQKIIDGDLKAFLGKIVKGVYKIDGPLINVNGDVTISDIDNQWDKNPMSLEQISKFIGGGRLKIRFGTVTGEFHCDGNYSSKTIAKLKTMEGFPHTVNGSFTVSHQEITNLEHAPTNVGGDFYCAYNRLLRSLSGSKQRIKVGGDFSCHNCGKNFSDYKSKPQFSEDDVKKIADVRGEIEAGKAE